MEGDKLLMSAKERQRKAVLEAVREGYFKLKEAAKRLKVSYRQARRIYRRYRVEGDKGLIHRNCGKPSAFAFDEVFKQEVLQRYKTRYLDFKPTFATEKLAEEGYILNRETLRLWLKEAGLLGVIRKRSPYRKQRERRKRFGELLQLDGSFHPWFGKELPTDCLMNLVDDATGITMALLAKEETTEAAMILLKRWIERYGVPKAIYVDLKTVYVSPKKARLDELGEQTLGFTYFSKACEKLGIEVKKAYSPQAKGRVERKHGVFQDRFVKELALRNIKTIAGANAFLEESFLEQLNKKFARTPCEPEDAHRDVKIYGDLNQIFCWEDARQVKNDWTIQFYNRHYQIKKTIPLIVRPKHMIIVREHLDGSLSLWFREQCLSYVPIEAPNVEQKVYQKKGYDGAQMSKIARLNKHKTPWSQFNPSWLQRKTAIAA